MGLSRRAVLTFAVALVGCSSKPSDSDAVRLFMEFAKRDGWVRFMELDNVRRINGYEKEGGYVVEIQYDAVPKKDFDEVVAELQQIAGDDFLKNAQLRNAIIPTLRRDYGEFKKG